MDKKDNDDLSIFKLKPSGSYLDSLMGFADLLGTIEKAESAANELLRETGGAAQGHRAENSGRKGAGQAGPRQAPPAAGRPCGFLIKSKRA